LFIFCGVGVFCGLLEMLVVGIRLLHGKLGCGRFRVDFLLFLDFSSESGNGAVEMGVGG